MKHLLDITILPVRKAAEVDVVHLVVTQDRQVTIDRKAS